MWTCYWSLILSKYLIAIKLSGTISMVQATGAKATPDAWAAVSPLKGTTRFKKFFPTKQFCNSSAKSLETGERNLGMAFSLPQIPLLQ